MANDRSQGPRHRRLQGRRRSSRCWSSRARRSRSSTALVTLESDKATMECRRRVAGVVKEIKVKVGDKVSEGSVILTLEARGRGAPPRRAALRPQPAAAAHRRAATPRRAAAPVAGAAQLRRQGRHRMRDAGARRRSRRLLRRVPRRRPRHEDGAGRALRDARRRLPQRRLHPVEGAAAHRRGDGRGRRRWPTTASRSARRRSTSTSCAASRTRWSGS